MGADPVKKIINRNTGGVGIMNKSQKELVLMDCRIMLKKLGDIPFDLSYEILQKDLWNIGNKYGITGPEVFMILMNNFPKKEGRNQ